MAFIRKIYFSLSHKSLMWKIVQENKVFFFNLVAPTHLSVLLLPASLDLTHHHLITIHTAERGTKTHIFILKMCFEGAYFTCIIRLLTKTYLI